MYKTDFSRFCDASLLGWGGLEEHQKTELLALLYRAGSFRDERHLQPCPNMTCFAIGSKATSCYTDFCEL